MPYVDQTFYTDTYRGELVSVTDFPNFEEKAAEMIDEITSYRMNSDLLLLQTTDIQTRFKKAVCAQIEFINANGGTEIYTADNLQSAGLGKFNYTASGSGQTNMIAPMAYKYLNPTGLLYRGL
ncbi:MAG: hypothetical protein K0S04_3597 [Herbinix sp.]|nr:hypothetical protein [Herbinix sp.]